MGQFQSSPETDIARDPNNPDAMLSQRDKAVVEYRAALATRDSQAVMCR